MRPMSAASANVPDELDSADSEPLSFAFAYFVAALWNCEFSFSTNAA